MGLCGAGDGDAEAGCFELAGVAAGLAVGVDGGGVEVRAKVVVAGGAVDQEVPDDDQQGVGDRDERLEFAAAFDQSPVAFAEEGAGLGGGRGGVAPDAFEVGVALGALAGAGAGAGLDGPRAEPCPRR